MNRPPPDILEEGITDKKDLPNSTNIDKNYTTNHIVVITASNPPPSTGSGFRAWTGPRTSPPAATSPSSSPRRRNPSFRSSSRTLRTPSDG